MLTPENKIWLESAAGRLSITPESLINGILRQIRTEFGSLETSDRLENWLKNSLRTQENLELTLEQGKESLRAVEETAKAIQLYLNQIQRGEDYASNMG